MKKGFITDIERDTEGNDDFRRVLYTASHMQLVVMSLKPGEEIGEEVHDLDQFIRIEEGEGTAYLDGHIHPIHNGSAVIIPEGTRHNIVNTGSEDLKLYTLYAPPEHRDKTIRHTKEDAENAPEHFDGTTSE